ncbi:MAG: hypothetical protein SWO11_21235 [Thermodesulfobacteriota bacterium]|nr:hypothetical protein [Thermodesulfobacteriota bacterium]
MDRSQFEELMNGNVRGWEGDNALQGLKVIEKYIPGRGIDSADRGIIYSVDVDELIDAGITVEDVEKLCRLDWFIEDNEYLACYV